MIAGISKKLIFTSFLFINFIQPTKSAELYRLNKSEFYQATQLNGKKLTNNKTYSNSPKNLELYLAVNTEKLQELVIESDIQSEINNVIYAEGNVSVSYRGKLLEADNLIYDKLNKKISAKGNITLILGDQLFRVSQLEYNFILEKGYLLDVEGYINTSSLISDLSSNFSLLDYQKLESALKLNSKKVLNTPNKVENWLFFTDKINIDGKKWKSKKALFSNDLLELKQVKLAINSLEVTHSSEELRFKSSLNYLILEDKLSVPFWMGD